MTIVNPSPTEALRQIEMPTQKLLCGNGRGLPMRRYSIFDSTLLLVAVQTIVVAALLPLDHQAKLSAVGLGVVFTLIVVLFARRRAGHIKAVREERAAIIRWLAIHTGLDHRNRLLLAWSEPQEIGENQYEFRTMTDGHVRSLVIDLDIQVASLATL
ncbi:hypothetical protein [Frondihabitans cladoniiphilus]|uniref:PH (Pleckstrin Homology) domain-containing protein n=1 Tax=Frondihabitans cladoniiphilus TaxID=715785 RepID=A0ABP8W5B2_9MICO